MLPWRIPQRQIRNLDVRNTFHYVHMILILTVVISESESEIIRIVLVCNSCQFVPTLSLRYIDEKVVVTSSEDLVKCDSC